MNIKEWVELNKLQAIFRLDPSDFFKIGEEYFMILYPKEGKLFNSAMQFILSEDERQIIKKNPEIKLAFEWGGSWYYSPSNDNELIPLRYIGKALLDSTDFSYSYLGVHGGFEMMVGMGSYSDWAKKAKFYNCSSLGICEKHTLAGAIQFQSACIREGIKPIIGETFDLRLDDGGKRTTIKLYVKNEIGWKNLLALNTLINVNKLETIPEESLFYYREGLICVIGNYQFSMQNLMKFAKLFGDDVYYQWSTLEWKSNESDIEELNNLKRYLEKGEKIVRPVLLTDSYYLEPSDKDIQKELLAINGVGYYKEAETLHFKSLDEEFVEIYNLFKQGDKRFDLLFEQLLVSTLEIQEKCSFTVPIEGKYLADYPIETCQFFERAKERCGDSNGLFITLIENGIKNKLSQVEDLEPYNQRLEREITLIEEGGFIDYFLILWDIFQWCKSEGILLGPGRGSVVGSLVAYLLDITQVDPLEYDLIFERFLNDARIGKKKIKITLDEGKTLTYSAKDVIIIIRNGEELSIFAEEIKEGDFLKGS